MTDRAFVWYDVFTDQRFAGNPLAVFPDAAGLDPADMPRIARELNLSETTFVLPPETPDTTHRVRIFTPTRELPFAGHPTLGTAIALADLAGVAHADYVLGLNAGPTPVTVDRSTSGDRTGRFRAPQVPKLAASPLSTGEAAALVGLDALDLDPSFPVHLSNAGGTVFLMLRLNDLAALGRARPDGTPLNAMGIYLATPTATGWRTRMFAPEVGVVEDPATGSAAVCFAGSLAAHVPGAGADGVHDVTIEQGVEMGRPSRLSLSYAVAAGQVQEVHLAGGAVKVLDGSLTVTVQRN